MDFSLQTAKYFLKNSQKKVFKPKSFKEKHSLEKRVSESAKIMEKYPNRIPVICQKIHFIFRKKRHFGMEGRSLSKK